MTRLRSIAVAFSLAVASVSVGTLALSTAAQAAEQTKVKFSKAVAIPLQAAQKAINAKQLDVALTEIRKAQAVEKKTPAEDYQIDEFLGYILVQQKKYSEAVTVFERLLASGLTPAESVDDRQKSLAQMYFQIKDYKKSAEWTKKWLDKHPGNDDMSVLLAQSYYLTDDYKNAAAVLTGVIANAERNGQTPKESNLELWLSAYFKQNNKEGLAVALKKIVRYFPKPNYWTNLIDISKNKATGDRATLGYYRLMSDVGVLKDKGEVQEAAQLAIEAGIPGDAEQFMTTGVQNGVLKTEDKTEQGRIDRLLAAAKKQAATDRATLAQLAKDAEKAPKGQANVALGEAYLSYGMVDEAIAALQAGIKKGGATDADEAQISLGVAYLKKGQKDQARQAFKAVSAGKWSDLAELWSIHSYTA